MRAVRVASAVVIFLFFFFHFSGCEFSPTDPETGDQNQGPTVTLLQPEDGEVVTGTVTLVAKASDTSGIKKVTFYLDGKLAKDGVVTKPPYEYDWDTTTLPDSSVHAVSVGVMAKSGRAAITKAIYVTVYNGIERPTDDDTTPPSVKIIEPTDGITVSGVVLIEADASDNVAVKNVRFYIDGELADGGTDNNAPYEYVWDTNGKTDGSTHTISAMAEDFSGNTAPSQTIHVTVGVVSENPQPLGPGGTWDLVFSDEFEGNNLDLTKWHPNWFGRDDNAITRPINGAEASCYDPAQVTVSGGYLHFTAVRADHADCVTKDGTRADYASGMIMSNGRYHFTYGFIEARIYLPPGTGTAQNWAAFWTNGQDWPQDGEIDIMETLGGGGYTRWTYHYDVDSGPAEDPRSYTPGGNMIEESGWHVFGAYWEPDLITFYYDGAEVGYVASRDLEGGASITSSSHYIILNLALNTKYPITVPSTMMVDYVRHWNHNPEPPVYSSNENDYASRTIHE